MTTEVRLTIRIPTDAAKFLSKIAKSNFTSRNAEIVRSLRERMEREINSSQKATVGRTA